MSKAFRLQDPGEGIREAKILDVLVSSGDTVSEGDHVLDAETDKSAVEIRADFSGTIEEVQVAKDAVAQVGDVLMTYRSASNDSSSQEEAERESTEKSTQDAQAPTKTQSNEEKDSESKKNEAEGPTLAAPSTRRLALEEGVDIDALREGSGPAGRVLDKDVLVAAGKEGAAKESAEETHKQPAARKEEPTEKKESRGAEVKDVGAEEREHPQPGRISEGAKEQRREKLEGVRRATAQRMVQSWSTIPHVMHHDEVAIDSLEAMRREHGQHVNDSEEKPTLTAYLVKALTAALRQHPHFNVRYDDDSEELVYLESRHIGVAVATERGLLAPVVRDADRLSLREISREVRRLARRAGEGELGAEEMKGGSITLTNVGSIGGRSFTPIINPPEAAILGVGASYTAFRPNEEDGSPTAVTLLPLSLSFDHRLNDGAQAAHFVNCLKELLSDQISFSLDI